MASVTVTLGPMGVHDVGQIRQCKLGILTSWNNYLELLSTDCPRGYLSCRSLERLPSRPWSFTGRLYMPNRHLRIIKLRSLV